MRDFKFRKSFVEKLSNLLDSKIELIDALNILTYSLNETEKNKVIKLRKSLEKGKNFETSFSHISKDKEFLSYIKAGEKTANLALNLKILKEKYQLIDDIKSELISILSYPLIVIVVSIIILFILLTKVVPQFIEIYNSLNQEINMLTRIILKISNFLIHNYITSLIILTMLFALIVFMLKSDKILIYLPFYLDFLVLSFTQNMYSSFASKIEFLEALELCIDQKNKLFSKELIKIYKKIEKGCSISKAFSQSKYFSKEYKSYILIADNTANLEQIFYNLTIMLNTKLRYKIKIFLKIIEPISIIFVSIIVGIIVFAIMLPIFNMGVNL